MPSNISKPFLEAYSRGEITRTELSQKVGDEVLFGDVMLGLYEHKLPLPRHAPNLDSPAVQLLRQAMRAQHG